MLEVPTADDIKSFRDLLSDWREADSAGTDDVLSAALPLIEQVAALHETGRIAPLNGVDALRVSMGHLWFQNALAEEPETNPAALYAIEREASARVDVTGRYKEERDSGRVSVADASIAGGDETKARRAYYPGYAAWEQQVGHHDQLSDVFVLGLILGSLAMRLDLTDPKELAVFVRARSDMMRHNPRLHPLVSQIIEKMTELDRRKRPQDLRQIANALAHYRDQDIDPAAEEDEETPLDMSDRGVLRRRLHEQLRDRLFEINRRNRLIYFRETGGTINLTVGSMPNVIDYKAIRPSQLFYLNDTTCAELKRPIDLSSWLQLQDYGFLSASLDRIRLDAQRDVREYGFSQLRLVVAFLRWTNLKDAPHERINSPLILLPATLSKRKGVKDSFRLITSPTDAQINPALRYYLRKLYDIRLPETVDVSNMAAVRELHADLVRQLEHSAKGVDLALVETPRIMLVHRTARRRLDDFRRRGAPSSGAMKDYGGIPYSYARSSYEPLGVQIFERDIRVSRAPAYELAEGNIKPRVQKMVASPDGTDTPTEAPESKQLERALYAVDAGEGAGSHDWELDLCAVTLANFNYRKMTLVRDYADLISLPVHEHANFDLLFSDEARRAFRADSGQMHDNYMVLPADPSQAEAVARASAGESYVIQGPPGTGKSQTITNLIADYVARGKGVLFVCEKRAALDVVFHRLKQIGLGDVCTLIHDSQGDKKAFIEELKSIYEAWTNRTPRAEVAKHRAVLVGEIEARLAELRQFSAAMMAPVDADGPPLRELIEARLRYGNVAAKVSKAVKAALPGWAAFQEARPVLQPLRDALISAGYDGILARSPLRLLRGDLASQPDATARVERALPRMRAALADAAGIAAEMCAFLDRKTLTWEEMQQLSTFCRNVRPIADTGDFSIFNENDPSAERFIVGLEHLVALKDKADTASATAAGWDDDFKLADLDNLIAKAQEQEGKFFAFLSGDWRRAKGAVRAHYKGTETSVTKALRLLADKQRAAAAHDDARAAMEADCRFTLTADICDQLDHIWTGGVQLTEIERDSVRACLDRPDAAQTVLKFARQITQLSRAEQELAPISTIHARLSYDAIVANIDELADATGQIADFGDLINDLDKAGAEVSQTLRLLDMPFEHMEVAVLDGAIDRAFRRNRALDRFDSARLEQLVSDLIERHADLRRINGQFAVNACHEEYHSDVTRSNESVQGMVADERDWRRDFRRGRKTLENEFQKSRAYKSIRELFAGEAGRAMRRLKPVWLMSPLAVADILPLHENLFDVVIFDEASQIPLEDAIPTLYRSRQMIVVGDEMQLPPSSFFSGPSSGGEEEDDSSELYVYDLNADSFLTRASAALPRTLLAWHYRSQHEALIQFCNKAFYKGELQTIPSVAELPRREAIRVTAADDAATLATVALDQPLSFHRMQNSPYDSQRNPGEAAYIARLVREILKSGQGLSIGVVAFSQAQQSEIERALNALAATDREFRTALDLEEEREDDGQYVGLFVKNLENVQGDERDVIILSVCYGPDAKGRMLMNFGPINQNGGEKRLNVIFSRAKRHMMVVSSIDGAQITNTYNYGANALRKYLTYAQAASTGETEAMAASLVEFGGRTEGQDAEDRGQLVADQIAAALSERGVVAARNHGQSDLKCHVAVKRAGEADFHLAVQIDDREHYGNPDLAARYVVRPSILSAFGWKVMTVLGKDWREDPAKVIELIIGRL